MMVGDIMEFCEQAHAQLATLQGRVDALEKNIGTTCHLLQERLEELRKEKDARATSVVDAEGRLDRWAEERRIESRAVIDQWIENHESELLEERARNAEEYAILAIRLVEASIDDAERMILEAVAMRRDAEIVAVV